MDRLVVERYRSLVRRQSDAIRLAEAQIGQFARCFANLERTGQKVAEPQIAEWLNAHNVITSRRSGRWSPKTVADRLFIDQRLQIERARDEGLRIAAMLTDPDDIYLFERWHLNRVLTVTPPLMDTASYVREFADQQRAYVDTVAWQIRGGRKFIE